MLHLTPTRTSRPLPHIHTSTTSNMAAMTVSSALARTVALRAPARRTATVRGARVSVKASMDEAMPATPVPAPKPSMKDSVMSAMSFGGWAPELINGRIAQIAFVAGLGAELSTGESFTAQFAEHTGAIAFASGLITLASFMPSMQNAADYNANPASLGKSNGPWTTSAEMTNGRGAMVGLVAMLLVEKLVGGPLTGMFADKSSDELFTNTYYDESFAAQVEVPVAAPVAFAAYDATVVAPAPVVEAEPVSAAAEYAAAIVAEPIRVEGAVDETVEAETMAMGKAVSEAEEQAMEMEMAM